MRIIAGTLKGRRLVAPPGRDIRPTSDRLRETLFNVLGTAVQGARVLDGYAGTGAVGLEALSRGAARVTFVEQSRHALACLRANIGRCGLTDGYTIVSAGVTQAARRLERASFDLVLLDPPYEDPAVPSMLEAVAPLVTPGGTLVLEHATRRSAPPAPAGLRLVREIVAGDSALAIYRADAPGVDPEHGASRRQGT